MITKKTYLWGLRPKTTVLQCSKNLCKFRFVLKFRLQWSLGNCFLLGRCCSPRKNFPKLVIIRGLRPKRFFSSYDNAYLYSNSWNTPHSKLRIQRLETNTHLIVVPGLSAHPAHAHAGVGADLDAGSLGRTHRLLHGLHQVLCITHQHVCRLLILLGAYTRQTLCTLELNRQLIQSIGKLAFKHLKGGLTKMLELKYTLFRFTLYKTSSPTPTLDQGTMIYATKTLGLKEVLKNSFQSVYIFFKQIFQKNSREIFIIFQAMNTTWIHNKCHNFLYGTR